jgi:ribosomal protein L37E
MLGDQMGSGQLVSFTKKRKKEIVNVMCKRSGEVTYKHAKPRGMDL